MFVTRYMINIVPTPSTSHRSELSNIDTGSLDDLTTWVLLLSLPLSKYVSSIALALMPGLKAVMVTDMWLVDGQV